jgi:hypothetical protein
MKSEYVMDVKKYLAKSDLESIESIRQEGILYLWHVEGYTIQTLQDAYTKEGKRYIERIIRAFIDREK